MFRLSAASNRTHRRRRWPWLAATALFWCLPGPASAQSSWDGGGGTADWFTAGNWSPDVVPLSPLTVTINTASGLDPVVAGVTTGRAGRVVVGDLTGQSGTLTVTGALTVDDNPMLGSFLVGNQGTGTVTVSGGGDLTTGLTGIGNLGGSTGTVTVTGAGSTWTLVNALDVGSSGHGTLGILAGGTVSLFSTTSVGNDNGAIGAITVDGLGSSFGATFTNVGAAAGGSGSVEVTNGGAFGGGIFTVGKSGTGTLTVETGGDVTGSTITIGGGATGTATVDGIGSTIKSIASTIVGDSAHGMLTVSAGAVATGGSGTIGAEAAGDGAVTVTGAGSAWTIISGLTVGGSGAGALAIDDGGAVASATAALGTDPGAAGSVTVTGEGSSWTVGSTLTIGVAADAAGPRTIEILDGGTLTVGSGGSGHGLFANGATSITVDGDGSALMIQPGLSAALPSLLRIGGQGTNLLDVTDGAALSVERTDFTTVADSSIAITASGAETRWSSSGLMLGGAGAASFAATAGATVETGATEVVIDGTGTAAPALTVSGGASFTSTGSVRIGKDARGSLLVESGGTLAADFLFIGQNDGSTGTATITGAGSTLTTTAALAVGLSGEGSMRLEDGASLITKNGSSIAGTMVVTGEDTTWTTPAGVGFTVRVISVAASGRLTIEDGAGVLMEGPYPGAAVTGALVVTGEGSRLETATFLVGNDPDTVGTVEILAGGTVSNATAVIGTGGFIGTELSEGIGVVTVLGAGSTWTTTGTLDVGFHGEGTLNVLAGAVVSSGDGYVGSFAQAGFGLGSVTVSGGGSTWTNGGVLRVGDFGEGTLLVEDGGSVTSSGAAIGAGTGGVGRATVTGTGSRWSNTGTMAIGGAGTGTLTVAAGGTVSATGAVSINEASTLAIGAGAAAGTFSAPEIALAGTLRFDHTGDAALAAVLSGDGDLVKAGPGTATLTGLSPGFTGTTSVDAGTLLVDGTIGGSTVTVAVGATLGGTGTVGPTSLGGTVAPGHSIGVLSVAGDYFQGTGSTYAVEIDAAGASDRLAVSGAATIAGDTEVRVFAAPGSYAVGDTWTILTAASVTGTFERLSDDAPFIDFDLLYDPDRVLLTVIRSDIAFVEVGETPNQRAVAAAIEALGPGALYDAVVALSAGDARDAFDQLSGEIHASLGTALLDDTRFFREAVLARLSDGGVPADAYAVWGRLLAADERRDGDGNAAGMEETATGFFAGVDRAGDGWSFGIASGFRNREVDVPDRRSSTTVDSLYLAAYGGWAFEALRIRGGVAAGWHDVATARTVAFPGFADTTTAGYPALSLQAFGEAGWRVALGSATVEPFAGLAFVHLATDGFDEDGGPAALSGAAADRDLWVATLGVRGAATLLAGDGLDLSVRGMVGWRHAFGDTDAAAALAFAGGAPFTIEGVPSARDAVAIEAALDLRLGEGLDLAVGYTGAFAAEATEHAATATFTLRF